MIELIEATVIGYLSGLLHTTNVYAERPVDLPVEYYIVEKTAAGEENHIQKATVAVQSISSVSMLNAAVMSKSVEKAMKSITSVAGIGKCKLNSAYNFTNSETREYRYQAIFDLTYVEGE